MIELKTPVRLPALALLTALTVLCTCTQAEDGEMLRLAGSRYTHFTATDIAKYYHERHPGSRIVLDHVEPYSYVQSLLENTADGIMTFGRLDADSKIEAAEQGVKLREQMVGWGAVVLVAHPDNPIEELTLAEARKIFLGEYVNWQQLGGPYEPIVTMSRDESVSGTQTMFSEAVLDGYPPAQKTVRLFDPDIGTAVSELKGAIADARYNEAVRARIRNKVKIIAIKKDANSEAVMPSVETVRNGTYPLSAPLFVYCDSKVTKLSLRQFVNFWSRRGVVQRYAESLR